MDVCQGFLLGVMDHIDVPAVVPADVNPHAVAEVRHRDRIGREVVATEGECVAVHVVAPLRC